jgi:hypothetical protein
MDGFADEKCIALKSVRRNGDLLRCFHDALRADKDVVLAAVKDDSSALEYASDELKPGAATKGPGMVAC